MPRSCLRLPVWGGTLLPLTGMLKFVQTPTAPACLLTFMASLTLVSLASAQSTPGNIVPSPTWETQRKARVYQLSVPPPRGIISDRHGTPLAASRVGWDLCRSPTTPSSAAAPLVPHPSEEDIPPERLREAFESLPGGYYTSPRYYREYPLGSLAGHVLGHIGRRAPLRRGPVENGDFLFTEEEGRAGLEAVFDEVLRGVPGVMTVNVDQTSALVHRKMSRAPVPGKNVVTSLDTEVQKILEEELSATGRPSAGVIVDPRSGDILAAASSPSYAPSSMSPARAVPSSGPDDPLAPMLPRVFRGTYPPASAFKPFVALAVMGAGAVTPDEKLGCPPSIKVGDMLFRNWSSTDSGEMDVTSALSASCNTWFYRAALRAGAAPLVRAASEFGFGHPPPVLFPSPASGLLPDDRYMLSKHGRRILQGDIANLSIGQGDLLATPLQMVMAYAALGNGGTLWRPRLVLQVQEIDNTVTAGYPARPHRLSASPRFIEAVVLGLEKAVESGTGRPASVKGLSVAGKTGTAQWGPPSEKKRLAWFCGFAPSRAAEVAFAFLIEGRPSQSLAGADAAALAGRVLRRMKSAGLVGNQKPTAAAEPSGSSSAGEIPEAPADSPVEIRPAAPVEIYEQSPVDLTLLLEPGQ